MKTTTTPLKDLLRSRHFVMADLYKIEPVGGTALYYTAHDQALTWAANRYLPLIIRRSQIREQIGMDVGELQLEIFPKNTDLILNTRMTFLVQRGFFDGARITLFKGFAPAWGVALTGVMERFSGRVTEPEATGTRIGITVRNDLELLNVKFPRRLYQPGCIHTLFDGGCGLSKGAYGGTGSVTGTSTASTIAHSLGQPAGWYALGTITFTSGANSGISRSIKAHVSGTLTLAAPLPVAPSSGDTFLIYPGCDKQKATCESGKFNNLANFRGHPFIPVPETAL